MKHNRSRDGLVIALAFLNKGDKASAVEAFSMLTAGEEVEEVIKELDETSEASAKKIEAAAKKNKRPEATRKILANLRKALAAEGEGADDEDACDTTKAADAQNGPGVDEGSGELLTSDNPDVIDDSQVTSPEQLEEAPSETVEAAEEGEDEDTEEASDDSDEESDEEEASVTASAAARLERVNRNLAIVASLRKASK
jgi:hypothetical protein